jgi:PleD family two-component response regulator
VADPEAKILIVEDDPDVADMVQTYLQAQGYKVMAVNWGEEAIPASLTGHPDLVILDIRLPDIDGYQVAERLRSDRRTQEIPIIFLTEKQGRADRLHGLELGADDYITKPFDVQELRLRVRNALRRTVGGSVINPVTDLPEEVLSDERLRECLESNGWAAILISLQYLEDFRENYGFVASDDVLRAVGLMIRNAVREVGGLNDYVGHLGPTHFLLVTRSEGASVLKKRIRERLGSSMDYFYPLKDRDQEGTRSKRMNIRLNQVDASQGPFVDLEDLKSALLGG